MRFNKLKYPPLPLCLTHRDNPSAKCGRMDSRELYSGRTLMKN